MSIPTRLLEIVRRCLCSLPDVNRGLVAAVSGGPDSVALLRILLAARPAETPLVLAHLNHQLRGAESDADEAFVAELHATLTNAGSPALTLHCQRLDVAAIARAEGANLEATARRERYRFLAQVARTAGLSWIATGHTANDQAETVLHRLLRGTGLQGLRGIAPHRQVESGIGVVRPLLQVTRAEILDCLSRLQQPYREDSSNANREYTRNRIRLELLPHLAEHYNPQIVAVLARLAEQAEEIARSEDEAVERLLAEVELLRAGDMLVLNSASLSRESRQRVREVFRRLWSREGWPVDAMCFDSWERLADLVLAKSTAVDLPGRIHARRRGRVVQLRPQGSQAEFDVARVSE